jgi:peptide/nickel transport system substrate-binding protein
VWVARSGDGTVARIDPETRRVAETIRVHNSPSAIAVAEGSVWTAVLAAPASHRGGTLRVESQPFFEDHLEPEDIYGPLSLVYDGLLAYRRAGGPGFGTLVGDLATDVPKPGPDGTTYVFKLRPGIRYSNGAPVRPEDFRASLEATFRRLPALSVFRRIRGAPGCSKAPSRCDLSSGIVTDAHAHTITLRLTSPDPDLLPFLAHPLGYVVPAGQTFGSATGPAGTGPYRVASFDRKRGARLVRNRYFRVWSPDARPAGFADEIAIRPGKDVSAQVAAVEHGQADVVEIATAFGVGLPPARLRALETRSAGQLHTSPAPELDFMWLNTRTPPFDDARVRRALNYAVDRRAITRIAGGPGLAQPTCQYLPPGFPNYAPSCRYTRHPGSGGAWSGPDIAQARRLIEQSGTRGMAVTVWVYKEKRGYGRYFARLLHTLGYRASLRVLPEYEGYHMHVGDSRTRAQIGIDGWSADDEAPSAFTAPFVCSSFVPRSRLSLNPAEFCDRSLDARIETARGAGGTQANALWRGVYGGLAEAAPAVPLVNRRTMTLVSARVGNYQHHPLWSTLLDQLWVR